MGEWAETTCGVNFLVDRKVATIRTQSGEYSLIVSFTEPKYLVDIQKLAH